MKAVARVTAEFDGERTVLRELASMAPLILLPRRSNRADAVVHLVNSATAPLGGDDLDLTVRVRAGATLRLSGVAATLALPGPRGEPSSSAVRIEVERGGRLDYLPEPTVLTARARHRALLTIDAEPGARVTAREVLVLGRAGERPGLLETSQHVVRAGTPVLRQTLRIGDPALDASVAYLAGRRVLATELLLSDDAPREPASGEWWSRTPLAAGGTLVTALANDAVTATRELASAHGGHAQRDG
ncbi:urease accessory protein UreD [Amycolatopsis sp. CA-230715]|uniref:urease accessory protein UreD n=1 Tax=Amycolatopsis sp. CA-230715 TaxID=2745196 RepID=UPI001C0305F9|nr:urease accessory protein UreD [Amycolatopsis sp. CA-230715]QWF81737.1 Urease accessory protein UreD [Amycolatopsis sp. CA-230715]